MTGKGRRGGKQKDTALITQDKDLNHTTEKGSVNRPLRSNQCFHTFTQRISYSYKLDGISAMKHYWFSDKSITNKIIRPKCVHIKRYAEVKCML